ncbi:tRNA lysidine(34) synthetase TilS [Roseibacillus ishigakijimensis]|uniref:tRNA(Ile)-lysidine synthase n=1 Tax=Roseibacillus ishigakijimensis TaxID=454146 RepID=A0A934VNE2_9BACT|nr:tRNA lysidine(34) synthetase TilS [Roseibacillus ishigakijimensis]MBK1835202.1 tRNA lysidine(34) synthetase TilS [Roseibacillus ishigakijimensis]
MLDLQQLSPDRSYLLGLSGGRDSVALLHLLLAANFTSLHLVHLHHGLRDEEADADARWVEELATRHHLPLSLHREDVEQRARESGQSLEAAARTARHELFARVARETQCPRVLLAHHAEDQAETILFNLLRGSAGLRGMSPRKEIVVMGQPLELLRPLLQTRRRDLEEFLRTQGHCYRDDSSNESPDFTRNRLKHEALPLLCDILQRDVTPALLRAAEIARDERELVEDCLAKHDLRDPQGRLFLPKLRELAPALQRQCLLRYLQEKQVPRISHRLLHEAQALLASDGPPALPLPGKRLLRRRQGRIFIV